MSEDRRVISESEIMALFEYFLRKYCERNNTDTLCVTDEDGKKLYQAVLIDKD